MARNPASSGAGADAEPLVDLLAMEPHDAATADEWYVFLTDPIANRTCADGQVGGHMVNGHPLGWREFRRCGVRSHP